MHVNSRLDFERSARFQQISLVANSTDADRPVRANIQLELLDIDDVAPQIRMLLPENFAAANSENSLSGGTKWEGNGSVGIGADILHLEVEENAPAGRELAVYELQDPDSRKHRCQLVGQHADKLAVQQQLSGSGAKQASWGERNHCAGFS